MRRSRQDGLYFLVLGAIFFVFFGSAITYTATDSMEDFREIYHGTRCLLQHCDPYSQSELLHFNRAEVDKVSLESKPFRESEGLYIYLPSTFPLIAPFAMLPWLLASVLWQIVTAACLILAAFLTWNLAAEYAPILAGGLICLLLVNSAIVFANGNPAGIAVGLCVIAVWCFIKKRYVPAGILCFAISLAIKPHDAGLVWVYFLLAGGDYRKRALQTLGVTVVLSLAGLVWISGVAPHWMPEIRSNMATLSAHGGPSDPGPDGLTSKNRTMNVITDLQSVASVFRDDPGIYNPAAFTISGALLLMWLIATLRSRLSPALIWIALAAVVSLTMLVTYHRAYDAKLLLLTVPACAMLWAEGGLTGRVALLVNTAGLLLTGEIPLAIFNHLTKKLHFGTAGLGDKLETVVLMRPAPLILLVMSIFYLWIYFRRAGGEVKASPR